MLRLASKRYVIQQKMYTAILWNCLLRFYNMFGTFTKKRFVDVSFEHCYNIINVL